MPSRSKTTRQFPPYAWKRVLHFANATPTSKNWVAFLLGSRKPVPIRQTYGFSSIEELQPVLARFRETLGTLVASSVEQAENSMILDVINERARGILTGWTWLRGTGRVFPQIRTENDLFEESLYAQLALALSAESFASIQRCGACHRFVYVPQRRAAVFCSTRCRAMAGKLRATRYREEHREKYRAYQRQLMAKRRREGTA